jgi:meiotic recombination protein SPO11
MPPKSKRATSARAATVARRAPTQSESEEDLDLIDAFTASTARPTKRKQVQLADDADLVLAKCRELRDDLRRQSAKKDDESDYADASASEEDETTLATLSLPNKKARVGETKPLASLKSQKIVEVTEMNTTEVMEGIEHVAINIAKQVLGKRGFQLEIPSRASSNQIYVPELDRIVLGDKRGTRSFLNVKVRLENQDL